MTIENIPGGGTSITGNHDINLFALQQLVSALKFEIKTGIKISRVSAYATAKKKFHLKGNKQNVYNQLLKIVPNAKIVN